VLVYSYLPTYKHQCFYKNFITFLVFVCISYSFTAEIRTQIYVLQKFTSVHILYFLFMSIAMHERIMILDIVMLFVCNTYAHTKTFSN
jgi:hypothetical protein